MLAEARAVGGDIYQKRGVLIRFDENGDRDYGFGTDGLAVVTEEGFVADMIVQKDGRIVVLYANRVEVGPTVAYAMARFEVTGRLDTSFGDAGILDVEAVYSGSLESITYDAALGV